MSVEFYQFCAVLFLAQGVALPVLAFVSGRAWLRQSSELEALSKEAPSAASTRSEQQVLEKLLARLPKLAPLQCQSCGASLRLGSDAATCSHCVTRRPLPEDYAALARLRPLCAPLIARANRHARLANALQHPLTRFFFRAMIPVEPGLFVVLVIGANLYPDTPVDRALQAIGEGPSLAVMLMSFLGFMIWMVVFIMLASLASELRKDLSALPALRPVAHARESASCAPCGGPIEYDGGALAALCDYCHVVSYRAHFAGQERAQARGKIDEADSLLFGAMRIIEDHTGTFFFTLSIMLVGSALLSVVCALARD